MEIQLNKLENSILDFIGSFNERKTCFNIAWTLPLRLRTHMTITIITTTTAAPAAAPPAMAAQFRGSEI